MPSTLPFNLNLPETPKGVPEELFSEFRRIYAAIKLVGNYASSAIDALDEVSNEAIKLVVNLVPTIPIGGHRAVVLDDSGNPIYATNLDDTHSVKLLGITSNAAGVGEPLEVVRMGQLTEGSWSWTLNQPIFLGINGLLTQTPPASPAFSRIIAFPRSTTSIQVDFREPLILT